MRKFLAFMLLFTCFAFGQNQKKTEEYHYGQNGIEYIAKIKNGKTIIVSTYNSRPTIKDEVAKNLLNYYQAKNPVNGDTITIQSNEAIVIGTLNIKTKNELTSLEFHYQTVEWKTGLTEVYKNLNKMNTAIATSED